MANSYYDVTGTPPSTSLTFNTSNLKYLETAHISIVVSNTTSGTSTTFTQTGSPAITVTKDSGTGVTTVNYSACEASFPAGANQVRIQRTTPSDNLLTIFSNASLLRSEDLNANSDQLLYVLQEQIDAGTGSLPLLPIGAYDAGNKRIINLADASDSQDATSFAQVSALVGNSSNSPSVAQYWEFNLGTGTEGTVADGHTSFTLDPTPASSINATFIVEIAGVIQRPDSDFQINGNVLKVVNQALNASTFDGTTIVAQNFGVSRQVFNFPVIGEASSASEVPITLKGFTGGDATELLKLKDSTNTDNATISAGGTIKAKVLEPLASGTLAVNPSTITTTGAITSGGDLTVGSASITQATGDATVNKLTISATSGFTSTQAVPKSYVDSSGGFGGDEVGSTDNINSYMTPGNFRGTTPTSPSGSGFPDDGDVVNGRPYALRITRGGASDSNTIHQELTYFSSDLTSRKIRFERFHSANVQTGTESTEWSAWRKVTNDAHRLNDLTTATGDYSMGSNKIVSLATPTADTDAANKSYVDSVNADRIELLASGPMKSTSSRSIVGISGLDAATTYDYFERYRSVKIYLTNVGLAGSANFTLGLFSHQNTGAVDYYKCEPEHSAAVRLGYKIDCSTPALSALGEVAVENAVATGGGIDYSPSVIATSFDAVFEIVMDHSNEVADPATAGDDYKMVLTGTIYQRGTPHKQYHICLPLNRATGADISTTLRKILVKSSSDFTSGHIAAYGTKR